jgi:Flp pilus assembly protein TadB
MEEPAERNEFDVSAGAAEHTNGDRQRPLPANRITGRSLPPRPEFETTRPRQAHFPWAVLLALMLVGGSLMLLTFLSTGLLLPLAFVAGGIFLVCGLHYVVWGWWLGAAIRREEEEDE